MVVPSLAQQVIDVNKGQPKDCLIKQRIYGDTAGVKTDDSYLAVLDRISRNHVMTSLRVCPDFANRNVFGV